MRQLAETFLHPRPDYLTQAIAVPRQALPALLDANDPQAVLEDLAHQAAEQNPLLQAIQRFIQSRTWTDSLRLVQDHPELLTPEADDLLGQIIGAATARHDDNAIRIFDEHRTLLRRCRELGVKAAFAQKMGLPPGADPSQAAAALPPELRRVVEALGPELGPQFLEIMERVSNQEELEAELQKHPQLRAALEDAAGGGSGLGEIPEDVRPILEELSRPARRADMPRRVQLCEQALSRVNREAYGPLWAALQVELANSLAQNPLGDRAENIEAAIAAYQQALTVYTPETMPDDHRRTQRNLAHLCFADRRWPEAIAAFHGALAAGDLLYLAAATPEARQAELREVRDLPARLSYALSQTAKPGDDATLQNAALALEQNRARWLTETLALRGERPESVPDDVWQAFAARRERIGQLQAEARLPEDTPGKRDFLTLTGELRAAYTALDQAIDAVRCHAPDFMPTPTFDDVRAALSPLPPGEGQGVRALVYFAVTPAGTVALLVTRRQTSEVSETSEVSTAAAAAEIHPLHTPLTEDTLFQHITGYTPEEAQREFPGGGIPTERLGGYLGAYARWLSAPRANRAEKEIARQAWFAALDATTHWLWDALMAPLVHTLADLNVTHAALIPSGWLAFLPLHAAWTTNSLPHSRGRAAVSGVGGADESSLPRSRGRAGVGGEGRTYALDHVTFSYAPSARALSAAQVAAAAAPGARLFAVDNPDSSLIFSRREVDAVVSHFEGQEPEPFVARGPRATRNTALHALPQCDVYHFSCHGANAWNAPLESALWMYGHLPLTVRDLLEQRGTQARLAFLSACETGLVGTALPDEVVGLASGFLQAGAAGVVSTLWAVNDRSTALLAERFYRHWKGDGMAPADALASAQRWLRDQAEDGRWSNPYYWAGFTLTGV